MRAVEIVRRKDEASHGTSPRKLSPAGNKRGLRSLRSLRLALAPCWTSLSRRRPCYASPSRLTISPRSRCAAQGTRRAANLKVSDALVATCLERAQMRHFDPLRKSPKRVALGQNQVGNTLEHLKTCLRALRDPPEPQKGVFYTSCIESILLSHGVVSHPRHPKFLEHKLEHFLDMP